MEWQDYLEQPSSYQFEVNRKEWSFEENKMFENALAELDHSSPGFFETLAARVPSKSIEDIKIHYQALVEDIELIESGCYPVPEYEAADEDQELDVEIKKEKSGSAMQTKRGSESNQQRRKGVPWTEEEHQLFLMGLNKYGKGDWRSISRYYVVSKTPTQVASHAQKYFRRQKSSTPMGRRRPSIHDIQTVSPAFTISHISSPTNTENSFSGFSPINYHGMMAPIYGGNFADESLFLAPITATMAVANAGRDQPSAAFYPSYLPLSSPMNRNWG